MKNIKEDAVRAEYENMQLVLDFIEDNELDIEVSELEVKRLLSAAGNNIVDLVKKANSKIEENQSVVAEIAQIVGALAPVIEAPVSYEATQDELDAIDKAAASIMKPAAITINSAEGKETVWFESMVNGQTLFGVEFSSDGGHALRDKDGFYIKNPTLIELVLNMAKDALERA